MARSFGTHFVITANATDDGAPVYLRADRSWSLELSEALTVEDEALKDELLAQAAKQQRLVCDPYAFKVNIGKNGPEATTTRERIRSQGPTTPLRRPDAQDQQRLIA